MGVDESRNNSLFVPTRIGAVLGRNGGVPQTTQCDLKSRSMSVQLLHVFFLSYMNDDSWFKLSSTATLA